MADACAAASFIVVKAALMPAAWIDAVAFLCLTKAVTSSGLLFHQTRGRQRAGDDGADIDRAARRPRRFGTSVE
jgi:hypothetical protein